jgi:excisionase family DNA binding protein
MTTLTPIPISPVNHPERLEKCFTTREVANAWNVSTRTIARAIKKGDIGVRKFGRNVRIPKSELQRWIDKQGRAFMQKVEEMKTVSLATTRMLSVPETEN